MKKATKKYRMLFWTAVMFSVISAFFMSRFSLYLGKVIDVISGATSVNALVQGMLVCFVMLILWLVFTFLFDNFKISYSNKIVRYIKQQLYESLYNQEMCDFLKQNNGDYISIFTKDIDLLVDNYLNPKCDIVYNLLSAVVCLTSIFCIYWKLGIAFVVISFITIIFSQIPGVIMAKRTEDYTKGNREYLAVLENYLRGFEQVRLLQLGKIFLNRLNKEDESFEVTRKKYLFATAAAEDFGMLIGMLSQLFCMSAGIWFVMHGDITVGLLISAVQLLNGVFSPLHNFVNNRNLMGTANEIIARIDESTVHHDSIGQQHTERITSIDYEKVGLALGGKQLFLDYSLHFEKGKKYAIIGESGRGKSSLVKLLLRYTEGYQGTIRLNQTDLQDWNSESIYTRIGYIQRNEFLIEGTVRDNIMLYREIEPQHAEKICRELGIDGTLLDKTVSASDIGTVSFGEKQRIDIARFMLQDYDVLIFDEPTSNLDAATAREVMQMIMKIQDKIVIVITHDTSEETMQQFHEVVKM